MNWPRVFLGGAVAGVVVNVVEYILNLVVMRARWEEAMKRLGNVYSTEAPVVAVWIAWGFIIGILLTWLYAAIRPRFGSGVRTAMIAGTAAWCLDCLLIAIAFCNLHLLPAPMIWMLTLVALPEHIIAAIAGAWVYRENAKSS